MASKYLSEHILASEYRCPCCGKYPPDFRRGRDMAIEIAMLFQYFGIIRTEYGRPIPISSGYRCTYHQLWLCQQGIADSPYSVHITGLALDLSVPASQISRLKRIARENVPDLRIGWRAYRQNENPHVHIDIGYLITPRWSTGLRKGAEW